MWGNTEWGKIYGILMETTPAGNGPLPGVAWNRMVHGKEKSSDAILLPGALLAAEAGAQSEQERKEGQSAGDVG